MLVVKFIYLVELLKLCSMGSATHSSSSSNSGSSGRVAIASSHWKNKLIASPLRNGLELSAQHEKHRKMECNSLSNPFAICAFFQDHLRLALPESEREQAKKKQLIISLIAMAKNSRRNTKRTRERSLARTHDDCWWQRNGTNGGNDDDNKCALHKWVFRCGANFRANMMW